MAFKKVQKVERKEPKKRLSVVDSVTRFGDNWRYHSDFGKQGIDLDHTPGNEYHDSLMMKCFEIGTIDRVCDVDISEGHRLLIEDRLLDAEKAAARAYDSHDYDADEPDQYGRVT